MNSNVNSQGADRAPLRVFYVSEAYTPHDCRFLSAFDRAGFQVTYLNLTSAVMDRRSLPSSIRNVVWTRWPLRSLSQVVAAVGTLRRVMKGMAPDVALVGPVHTAAFLVALSGFRPFIAMSWGSDLLVTCQRNRWAGWAARYALCHASGAFGDCLAVRTRFSLTTPLPDTQIVTFPWGVDLKQFSPGPPTLDLRRRLGWLDSPVIICTRSWEVLHAVETVIKAFSRLRQTHPAARLVLVGDGSRAPVIHALIRSEGLQDHVHVAGRVGNDSIADYYRLADLYVSAALSDGSSVSLIEAMACGLPVVVTSAYGNLEWVRSGENGWLVSPGDSEALLKAMDEALSCPQLCMRMREANRAITLAKANWDGNLPRLFDLMRSVARKGHEPRA